jgi:hypothetical protein
MKHLYEIRHGDRDFVHVRALLLLSQQRCLLDLDGAVTIAVRSAPLSLGHLFSDRAAKRWESYSG